jgi:hypothetical protein
MIVEEVADERSTSHTPGQAGVPALGGEPSKLSPGAVIEGLDKSIYVKELQLTLPLGAVYAGTDVDRS